MSDFSGHYLAPSNIDETCLYCGHAILPGELILEGEFNDATQFAHEACFESAQQDAHELIELELVRELLDREDA